MRVKTWRAQGLLILAAGLSCFAASVQAGGARGQVRLLEGGARDHRPANPRVETWTITDAVAYVDHRGDVEVTLGTGDVSFDGFAEAIDPGNWIRSHVRAAGAHRVTFSIYENPSHASAHAEIGDVDFTSASPGTVYDARIEDGHLRGRLVTVGGLRGSMFSNVQLDVPLWQPPAHQMLPRDGGEPGAALVALERALHDVDFDAVRALLSPVMLTDFPNREAFRKEGPTMADQFGIGHRLQKGLVLGDSAILISDATARGRQVPVRTLWERFDGHWKFTSMSFNTTELLDTQAQAHPFVDVRPAPRELKEQPPILLDDDHLPIKLRHARAMALSSGEQIVVLSDGPIAKPTPLPASSQALRWSALSADPKAQLMMLVLPPGGPEWDVDEALHGTAAQEPDSAIVNGELTRIGDHLSGVFTTLRFPEGGGVEDGERVLIDLVVE